MPAVGTNAANHFRNFGTFPLAALYEDTSASRPKEGTCTCNVCSSCASPHAHQCGTIKLALSIGSHVLHVPETRLGSIFFCVRGLNARAAPRGENQMEV